MQHRMREQREWEAAGGKSQDPAVFVREILPLIQPLSILMLSRATGLSRTYCQDLRSGKHVPHPRHWEAFRRAAGEEFGGYELGAETVISYHNPPFKLTLFPLA